MTGWFRRALGFFDGGRAIDLALGENEAALPIWRQVTEQHSYPRARVQLAELLIARKEVEPARAVLQEVIADDPHAPAFQRRRDRVWVSKARALLRKTGG